MASTAAVLIIGNEILSGRTQDSNLSWLGKQLADMGIKLAEARVVEDVPSAIIGAVNALRAAHSYVFTTGGIGPTHDDITSECIAKAFGVPLTRHPEADAILRAYYKPEDINEARMRMANTPQGAILVPNPVSSAPGYRMENVYVFAGVPRIMQAMFDNVRNELKGGPPILSKTISAYIAEGTIAKELTDIQNQFSNVEIGSYPMVLSGKLGTSLVARSHDEAALNDCYAKLQQMLEHFKAEILLLNQ